MYVQLTSCIYWEWHISDTKKKCKCANNLIMIPQACIFIKSKTPTKVFFRKNKTPSQILLQNICEGMLIMIRPVLHSFVRFITPWNRKQKDVKDNYFLKVYLFNIFSGSKDSNHIATIFTRLEINSRYFFLKNVGF